MHSRLGSPNILSTLSSGWLAVYFIGCAALAMLRWQSTIFTEAYNRLTGLLNTPSAEPFLYYDPLLMVSILLVAPLFYFAFRARFSNSLLIFLLCQLALWGAFWWSLHQFAMITPALEISSFITLALMLGIVERLHQSPLKPLLHSRQQWGVAAAKHFQEINQLSDAWNILKQLERNHDVLELNYLLAETCERKREYELAISIYRWLELQKRGFKDCKMKIERLTHMHQTNPNMSGTIIMDQTMLMPGEGLQPPTLGRYRIDSVLGKGAMGVVYRGVDPAINREVAIKTLALSKEFEDQDQQVARERFFREAETAGKLNHPNIVTIYDVGEEQDLAFIAMDLLTGVPLDQHNKPDTLLPVSLVYQLMLQIAAGLGYAHQKNVVHRDIKPGNIIYDDDKQTVIITDFGIAHLTDQSKTRTGAILGSPFYMSPEQVQGKKIDQRSDIFSLGVTFYQLLTGHLPFKGESLATVALNITTKKHEPVRKIRADLPASASRIVNKALHKEMSKRYQTVNELREALLSALKRDFKVNPFQ
ncbi:serine/threonine-protein kinase [Pleionea mediterranea]|uniref:non-specific serine/threonine protein kinase n=1 Tax=Pleionea mediterranea TaxID=523701 RepID=A0A316FZ89_9GAMM|nr:serine/threonine-protein kinase [Pleionea mediterranea]PWK53016.1 serine/threonine protein kinase [Pleionea mediterranea]